MADFHTYIQSLDQYNKALHPWSGQLVLSNGSLLLEHYSKQLKNKRWDVMESVAFAALEYRLLPKALEIETKLKEQFPGSPRVQRLIGMRLEAEGQLEEARKIYLNRLETAPDDLVARKHLISLLAGSKLSECVTALNRHVDEFVMDSDAWLFLSELYLSQSNYQKALFCVEELVLQHPENPFFVRQLAEISYAAGEKQTSYYEYFARACLVGTLTPRSLWGLILCSNEKEGRSKGKSRSGNSSGKVEEIFSSAATKLRRFYCESEDPLDQASIEVLDRMRQSS